jgi:hypothetical protein
MRRSDTEWILRLGRRSGMNHKGYFTSTTPWSLWKQWRESLRCPLSGYKVIFLAFHKTWYSCSLKYTDLLFNCNLRLVSVSMEMTAFWDMEPSSFVRVAGCFTGTYFFHHQDDNEGSTHLWNVDLLSRDYMALYVIFSFIPWLRQSM